MRVGILVYAVDKPLSGISRYAFELVRALTELPNAPEIVLLSAGPVGPLGAYGLPVVGLAGCSRLPGLMSIGNALTSAAARRQRLDVVHDTTGVTPFAVRMDKARRVVTVHDVIPLSFPGVSTRLDQLLYRHWLPRLLPGVDRVITVSACSKTDIARYLRVPSAKIEAIPLAANPAYKPASEAAVTELRRKLDLPGRYLLYLGSVEARKNLGRVLEALALLHERGEQLTLVVTGQMKWKYAEITETLDRLNLGDKVLFTGYVAEADLPALYTGARGLVFPSLYEGFGLPVLEAMACGAPVVTSTAASLPEVAGDAALLVDPRSVDAIAEAMLRLWKDDALCTALSKQGMLRAAQFSWRSTAQRTVAVYESCTRP